MTLSRHPEGVHGFDFLNDEAQAREVIEGVLEYFASELEVTAESGPSAPVSPGHDSVDREDACRARVEGLLGVCSRSPDVVDGHKPPSRLEIPVDAASPAQQPQDMDIAESDLGDERTIAGIVDLLNAAYRADAPFSHHETVSNYADARFRRPSGLTE